MEISKRQQRKNNRDFTGSRPNRRAAIRLSRRLNGYKIQLSLTHSDGEFIQPGACAHW